jgi:hypothetical protein
MKCSRCGCARELGKFKTCAPCREKRKTENLTIHQLQSKNDVNKNRRLKLKNIRLKAKQEEQARLLGIEAERQRQVLVECLGERVTDNI